MPKKKRPYCLSLLSIPIVFIPSVLDRLASGVRQAANGIAESNRNVKTAVGNAQVANGSNTDILRDSQRRISECLGDEKEQEKIESKLRMQ